MDLCCTRVRTFSGVMYRPESLWYRDYRLRLCTFLSACTVYGNGVMIRSATVRTVNYTGKDVIQTLILTKYCCGMDIDKHLLEELQLERPIKSFWTMLKIYTWRSIKLRIFRTFDKQRWKVKHSAGKHKLSLGHGICGITYFMSCCC